MTVQIVPLLQHITISDIKNKDTQYNDNTIMVLSQLDMGEYVQKFGRKTKVIRYAKVSRGALKVQSNNFDNRHHH